MPKIDLETVSFILNKVDLPSEKKSEIYEELNRAIEEDQLEKAVKKPRTKKEFLAVIRDHTGGKLCLDDFSVSLFQIERDSDPEKALESIRKAAVENNINAKKARNKVNNFNEIVSHLKTKWLKPFNVGKPSKEWLRVVFLDDEKFKDLSRTEE